MGFGRLTGVAAALAASVAGAADGPAPIVAYTITDGATIEESLTGAPGPAPGNFGHGAALYAAEPPAGCAACHGKPGQPGPRSGPDLAKLGARMSPGRIRLWIVAPQVIDSATPMPAFYASGQRTAPDDPLYGGQRLTAQEVEDLVAYLAGLK